MNIYAIPPSLTGLILTIIGLLVFLKNKTSKLNILFSLLSFSMVLWLFGYTNVYLSKEASVALKWARIGFLGIIFIPIFAYHFIISFLNLKRKIVLPIIYLLAIPSLLLSQTNYIYSGIKEHFWGYYPTAGKIYFIFLLMFYALLARGALLLLFRLKKESGIKREQMKYMFLAFGLGTFGIVDYLIKYPMFDVYPFGYICALLFISLIAFAIVRYRLMDIRVALTRAGVFTFVYLLVLGIPFAIAGWGKPILVNLFGNNWFWFPLVTFFVLATVGPFLFIYLSRQAEARLRKEEHHAYQLLMQGSSGMTQIRDLRKLLNLIVHFVPKIMKIKNASIFLLNNEATQYLQEAVRFKNNSTTVTAIDVNDPLIVYLKQKRGPLVYEEIKSRTDDKQFPKSEILSQMKALSASVILPCFIEDALLGFLILDEKRLGRMYTPEDLNVLTTLTNQAALAFENAQFYARDRENQALLYQSATLADMGVMADSMGHQIKNHIQKMMAEAGGNAGILEEILKQGIDNEKALQLLKRQIDILYGIEKQGEAGGRLIESINKFSRLPKAAFREITLKEILDTANDILRFKVKFDEIDYNIQIPDTLPTLYAHPILSEAFVNLIDNAYDAIREKEQEIELESKKTGQSLSYRGSISFTAVQQNNSVEIQVKDNGIGIKKDNIPHLFLPFYTTKATSAKGTGLGLFVIKKIVSKHKGRIKVDSEYMQGTSFTITIPIRQEK